MGVKSRPWPLNLMLHLATLLVIVIAFRKTIFLGWFHLGKTSG